MLRNYTRYCDTKMILIKYSLSDLCHSMEVRCLACRECHPKVCQGGPWELLWEALCLAPCPAKWEDPWLDPWVVRWGEHQLSQDIPPMEASQAHSAHLHQLQTIRCGVTLHPSQDRYGCLELFADHMFLCLMLIFVLFFKDSREKNNL